MKQNGSKNGSKIKNTKNYLKGGFKGVQPPKLVHFSLRGSTFFLTYKGTTESGEKLTKQELAEYLLRNPHDQKVFPIKYLVCQQMYDSGEPHFHAVIVYPRRKGLSSPDYFDYRGIHPNIQTIRNMKAALQYVYKEDAHPVTNMDIVQQRRVARAKDTSSLYQLLREQMMKDPFKFDPIQYCLEHDIDKQIYKCDFRKALTLIKQVREAACNRTLTDRPGIQPITRALIQSRLTPDELRTFDSWTGFQIIVDHLNVMNIRRGARQKKSLNLLITGAPNSGKSALVWQRDPLPGRTSINEHFPVYPMGMKDWFPDYKSDVYACIYWNQAKLTSYSYDVILQLLDGSPVMLPSKGGGHKKLDNPLIIMTSNMTLAQMIQQKFNYSNRLKQLAFKNLSVRVINLVIPENKDLFLLQRLLVPPEVSPRSL